MIYMDTNFKLKNAEKYVCNFCDFKCSKKSNYDTHLLTRKHQQRYNKIQNDTENNAKNATQEFLCKCGRQFAYNSGLWRHKQKCQNAVNEFSNMDDKKLIITLLQQNQDLQKSLIEMSKEKGITNNNQTQTHTNSYNKTFNLHFFLNETCKNALNISEFVSSIKPQLNDLEVTGRLGYVEGISNIILNNLKTLDSRERPFHCSDYKREVFYIKENNQWTKENETKPILTKAIKVIANENIKQINEWKKEYPDCTNYESKKNNMFLQIVSNSMSGTTKDETDKNINKIISNIAKEVIIQKE
jgi:hypothetical protein